MGVESGGVLWVNLALSCWWSCQSGGLPRGDGRWFFFLGDGVGGDFFFFFFFFFFRGGHKTHRGNTGST